MAMAVALMADQPKCKMTTHRVEHCDFRGRPDVFEAALANLHCGGLINDIKIDPGTDESNAAISRFLLFCRHGL